MIDVLRMYCIVSGYICLLFLLGSDSNDIKISTFICMVLLSPIIVCYLVVSFICFIIEKITKNIRG